MTGLLFAERLKRKLFCFCPAIWGLEWRCALQTGVWIVLMCIGLQGTALDCAGESLQSAGLPADVILVVDGRKIDTSRVKPADRWAMENAFFQHRRRAPSGPQDELLLQRLEENRRCEAVRSAITLAVQKDLLEQARITVSDEERAEYRRSLLRSATPGEVAAKLRAKGEALKEALDAVYEKGEDPRAVFERMKSRLGYSDVDWGSDVYSARDAERRKEVVRRLREEMPAHIIEYHSRPDASDEQIRLRKFKQKIYADPELAEFRTPPGRLISDDIGAVYGRWLKAQVAKSHVWLDNPVWGERCELAKQGIVVDAEVR